jgi:hypothetical protein
MSPCRRSSNFIGRLEFVDAVKQNGLFSIPFSSGTKAEASSDLAFAAARNYSVLREDHWHRGNGSRTRKSTLGMPSS